VYPISYDTIVEIIIDFFLALIAVWLASRIESKHSSFPRAFLATLGGVLIFVIIFVIFDVIGKAIDLTILDTYILGLLFGFIGVLGLFKVLFGTGWHGALLITLLMFIILSLTNLILLFLGIIASLLL